MSHDEGTNWLERLRHRQANLPRVRAHLPAWETLRSEIFDRLHAARQVYWAASAEVVAAVRERRTVSRDDSARAHALCRALAELLRLVDAEISYLQVER